MEYEAWVFVYLGAKQCDEIAVDLECIERAVARLEQQAGECSAAWSNFHEAIVRAGSDRSHDVFQDRGVVQEMLAKPLASRWLTRAGLGAHWGEGRRPAPSATPGSRGASDAERNGRLGGGSRGATHASHGRPRGGAPEYERGR